MIINFKKNTKNFNLVFLSILVCVSLFSIIANSSSAQEEEHSLICHQGAIEIGGLIITPNKCEIQIGRTMDHTEYLADQIIREMAVMIEKTNEELELTREVVELVNQCGIENCEPDCRHETQCDECNCRGCDAGEEVYPSECSDVCDELICGDNETCCCQTSSSSYVPENTKTYASLIPKAYADESSSVITSPDAGSWHESNFLVKASDSGCDSYSDSDSCTYHVWDEGLGEYTTDYGIRDCNQWFEVSVGSEVDDSCKTEGENKCRIHVFCKHSGANTGGSDRTFSIGSEPAPPPSPQPTGKHWHLPPPPAWQQFPTWVGWNADNILNLSTTDDIEVILNVQYTDADENKIDLVSASLSCTNNGTLDVTKQGNNLGKQTTYNQFQVWFKNANCPAGGNDCVCTFDYATGATTNSAEIIVKPVPCACECKPKCEGKVHELSSPDECMAPGSTTCSNLSCPGHKPFCCCTIENVCDAYECTGEPCPIGIENKIDQIESVSDLISQSYSDLINPWQKLNSNEIPAKLKKVREQLGECVIRPYESEAYLRGEKTGKWLFRCKELSDMYIQIYSDLDENGYLSDEEKNTCYGNFYCRRKFQEGEQDDLLYAPPCAEDFYCCMFK